MLKQAVLIAFMFTFVGCDKPPSHEALQATSQMQRSVAAEECPVVYLTEPWVSPCPDGERVCSLPDLNQDGEVGINDLLDVLALWGDPNCMVFKRGDINKDGTIDAADMLIILGVWGSYDSATWDRCNCG